LRHNTLAEHDPKLLAEIRGYLTRYRGRFGVGTCTYGQPLSTFITQESNIRQIAYALEADRRHFGSAPETYLMSEHAMHSQIPQILAGFGFRSAIMRTHYMMYGYNPTFDAPIGWWVGLDGSRIAAVPTYEGEGAQFGVTTYDNWALTRCPRTGLPGALDRRVRVEVQTYPTAAGITRRRCESATGSAGSGNLREAGVPAGAPR
jgi:alpha-mannosidase